MGMELWEYQQDEEMSEYYNELYLEELQLGAIEEFTLDRLRSFYLSKPDLLSNAKIMLKESSSILNYSATASLLLSAVVIEVAIKSGILKPIIYGLIHSEAVAEQISSMTIKQTGIDRFKDLLFDIVKDVSRVDLKAYKRDQLKVTLWDERGKIQKKRNRVAHLGEQCTYKDAENAYNVASDLMLNVLPKILKKLNLEINSSGMVVTIS